MGEIVSVQKHTTSKLDNHSSNPNQSLRRNSSTIPAGDPSNDLQVDPIWKEVKLRQTEYTNERESNNCKQLRLARFFVSSTFKDFTFEREFLVKNVFPEVEEICRQHKTTFFDCDLRWGIPKDFGDENTINVCLDTIDQCKYETGDQVFFISFLGSRYGWVPDMNKLSSETVQRHNWVPGTSITHMEIILGALMNKNKNALFFIREDAFLDDIAVAPETRSDYFELVPESVLKLSTLKKSIVDVFPEEQIVYYRPNAEVDENSGKNELKLTNFEEIRQKTVQFFAQRVTETFPTLNLDKNQEQLATLQTVAYNFIGRDREIKEMKLFLTNQNTIFPMLDLNQSEDASQTELSANKNTSNILLATGDAGIGKTTLLAKLVTVLVDMSEQLDVVFHFVPLSAEGQTQRAFITSMIESLRGLMSPKDSNVEDNKDSENGLELSEEELLKIFDELIEKNGKRKKPLAIIIDSIDLMNIEGEQNLQTLLSWIPSKLPQNSKIKFIISCRTNDEIIFARLRNKNISVHKLEGFEAVESRLAVETILGNFQKRLDSEQIGILLEKTSIRSPLWLEMACRELLVFGSFEQLTNKIESLPDKTEELTFTILERIVNEDQSGLILKAIAILVCCSRSGLREIDFRLLMGDMLNKNPLNAKNWSMVTRQLRSFVQPIKTKCDVILKIQHQSTKLAMKKLLSNEVETEWRMNLVKFFRDSEFEGISERTVQLEVPFQLSVLKRTQDIVSFFKKHQIGIKAPFFEKSNYLKRLTCQRVCMKNHSNETQLFICVFCKNAMRGMGQVVRPNVQCCVICSGPVHALPFGDNEAWYCCHHRIRTAPNCFKCFVCDRQIMPNMEKTALRKCNWCNLRPNQCSYLATKLN